ncbi:hypothetical protein Mal48_37270 [Thalassoglobus polymorphus]|uniref:Uncharacterized protein n=2 Tax=Thalassoglobus polymorphus TaxID=2527994 RepID=A0A517QS75_9PLAN|nr:hypothetical protein Mal48_37270 [Thalassoglobus polymorphus]
MSLAFGLTVLLTGLKPEEIRNALNSQNKSRHELKTSEEELTDAPVIAQRPQEEFKFDPAPSPDRQKTTAAPFEPLPGESTLTQSSQQPSQNSETSSLSPTPSPIRIASADVNASLGMSSNEPTEQIRELTPIPDREFQYAATRPIEHHREILVPEPVAIPKRATRESMDHEVHHLKKEILHFRLAEARREIEDLRRDEQRTEVERVESELKKLREDIAELKKLRNEANENLATQVKAEQVTDETFTKQQDVTPTAPVETIKPVEMTEVVIETQELEQPLEEKSSTIEVTAGSKDDTYIFKFENAEVRDVLTTISKYAGRKVVIRPDVEGTFTGHFEETSAVQAFAAVIKANNFGVSFLGDYVLVRSHRDPKIR